MVGFERHGYHARMRLRFLVGLGLITHLVACEFTPDVDVDPPNTDVDGGVTDAADTGVVPVPDEDAGVPVVACGDGQIAPTEACDDNNTLNGDGCSDMCVVEAGFQCFVRNDQSACELIPVLSLLPRSGPEGEVLDVMIILNNSSLGEVAFTYSTTDGTAVSPGDYTPVSGSASIPAGELQTTVQIPTEADFRFEPVETLVVSVDQVMGATIAQDQAVVQVEDVAPLTDRGLVVRYFLDERRREDNPATVVDSGPFNFNLPVLVRNLVRNPTFFGGDGQGGVSWSGDGQDGRLEEELSVNPGVRSRLDGVVRVTMETVAFVVNTANASRFIHVGGDDELGWLMLGANDTNLIFGYDSASFIRWEHEDQIYNRRMVLTLVIDTTLAEENDRTQLYIDGVRFPGPSFPIDQNTAFAVPEGLSLVIGNRTGGNFSPQGEIFYAAIYDVALSPAEVAANAEALAVFDDGP